MRLRTIAAAIALSGVALFGGAGQALAADPPPPPLIHVPVNACGISIIGLLSSTNGNCVAH
ncbi:MULTISPECIES: chaplin [unclassified Streptomyces]|uniref:chaplin n=1 Tax=unclassified Streptomyces TaxID=2593676 RepID=UPI0037FB85D4